MIRPLPLVLALLCLTAPLAAQDTVKMKNGDTLTGAIKSLVDGKIKFDAKMVGDVEVAVDDIDNLTSSEPVHLRTKTGDNLHRRIERFEAGRLVLAAGDGAPGSELPFSDLKAIFPDDTAEHWKGSIALSAFYVSGNTERRAAAAEFEAQRRTDDNRITARSRWDYAEEKLAPGQWNLSQRRLFGGLKYDYFLGACDYLWADTTAEGDLKSNLDLRYTIGAGYGRQLLDRDHFQLAAELGLAYFFEDYRTVGTPSSETVSARGSYDLEYHFSDDVRFLQRTEAFLGLETADDVFIKKDSRLQVDVTENMFSQLQWILSYDNTPAPGNERLDHYVLLAVGWTF